MDTKTSKQSMGKYLRLHDSKGNWAKSDRYKNQTDAKTHQTKFATLSRINTSSLSH